MAKKADKPVAAPPPALTVRHYCQGIGDCHLLTFRQPDGPPFRILIDCGVHSAVSGGAALIRDIVTDLRAETGGQIDVVVVTHEHWDHVSGFLTAADIFRDFSVGAVWMAWTENPQDPDATTLDRFRDNALSALQAAARRLDQDAGPGDHMQGLARGLDALQGFQFGAAGERVRAARNAAAALAPGQPPIYLDPGSAPFSPPRAPGLRVYVLGPPRDLQALRTEEKSGEMYGFAGVSAQSVARTLQAGLAEPDCPEPADAEQERPFNPEVGVGLAEALAGNADAAMADFIRQRYAGPLASGEDQSWRRIDHDWLGIAADLALQLDRGVNNTSLVLAFEMLDSGRVFLFPGDAQIGNWLSWQGLGWQIGPDAVTAADLLARTVYLKVAHHGSHNATPKARGLELMTSPDLSAFVPTSKKDALKVHWREMPFDGLLSALAARTRGRTIRADDAWLSAPMGQGGPVLPSGAIQAVRHAPRDPARGAAGLWVELDLT